MTTNTNAAIDFTAIGNAAAQGEDQSQMKEGGNGNFERPVPAAGPAIGRLLQYIELGVQPARPGSGYKDAEEVMLRFELSTPKHMIEIEKDGVKSKIPSVVDIRLPKGGLTSKYGRLFTALNYSGRFNHISQMIGVASWRFEVTHNVVGKGTDKEKTYANLDKNKAWTFVEPANVDGLTGDITPIAVPELNGTPKVFLYENKGLTDEQYLSLWDSIFIEGEHEAKGDKPAKTKNWIQETIQKGVKFVGSRLHGLTEGRKSGEAIPDVAGLIEESEAKVDAPVVDTVVAGVVKTEPEVVEDIDPLLAQL